IHVTPDNDRCSAFDRQRVEIKTEGNGTTPNYLKGFLGDTVKLRWRFRLAPGFQPSQAFTHLHQLKPFDGDDILPMMTLSARKGTPDILEVIHTDSSQQVTVLNNTAELQPLVGVWLEAYEKVTYGSQETYSLSITKVSDQTNVLSISARNLDL